MSEQKPSRRDALKAAAAAALSPLSALEALVASGAFADAAEHVARAYGSAPRSYFPSSFTAELLWGGDFPATEWQYPSDERLAMSDSLRLMGPSGVLKRLRQDIVEHKKYHRDYEQQRNRTRGAVVAHIATLRPMLSSILRVAVRAENEVRAQEGKAPVDASEQHVKAMVEALADPRQMSATPPAAGLFSEARTLLDNWITRASPAKLKDPTWLTLPRSEAYGRHGNDVAAALQRVNVAPGVIEDFFEGLRVVTSSDYLDLRHHDEFNRRKNYAENIFRAISEGLPKRLKNWPERERLEFMRDMTRGVEKLLIQDIGLKRKDCDTHFKNAPEWNPYRRVEVLKAEAEEAFAAYEKSKAKIESTWVDAVQDDSSHVRLLREKAGMGYDTRGKRTII